MTLANLERGWTGLALGWVVIALPMAVMTLRARQPLEEWLRLPFRAAIGVAGYILVMSFAIGPALEYGFGRKWMFGNGMRAAGIAIALAIGYLLWRYWNRDTPSGDVHLRGAVVMERKAVEKDVRLLKRRYGGQMITLAGIPVGPQDETKHFKIMGTTGSGKSTAIRELLCGALARGDRAIIADPDGSYMAHFYDPNRGDLVLNPFDARSVVWNPFLEIRSAWEVDQLARSLVPGEDEWSGYARTFISAVLGACWSRKEQDLRRVWHLVAVASADELGPVLQGTAAQPFIEEENARMFGSVRSVAVSALASLRFLPAEGADFAVREWVRSGRGVLFLPYTAEQIASLQSLIATWLRLGIFATMSLSEIHDSRERALWFVVDELDALGRIDGLKDALARLRKFGGRCVLGFQSIAQVSTVYGQGDARTIVENCSSTLILRCSSSEGGGTAEFASALIGQREVIRESVSVSHSREGLPFVPADKGRTVTVAHQRVSEAAVLAAEIEALPDLSGYLKLASTPIWVRVGFDDLRVKRTATN